MPTELKNAAISLRILEIIALGNTVQQAIDAVLGAGTYEKIASDVWEAAQK